MGFVKIIKNNKITLIGIFIFLYTIVNLLDGERGLISYFEKQNVKKQLISKKNTLAAELILVEKKNNLLSDSIDLDYLEILYREKFMVGKSDELIYKNLIK